MTNKPIQTDKFGDDGFKALFEAYALPLPEFKARVAVMVRTMSVSSKAKQEGFIESLTKVNSNKMVLTHATNFFMAGEGFKVLQVTKKN